jgi:glyoxylase-like metal-dependent hydrolase (beta-lactamase superfamily II)
VIVTHFHADHVAMLRRFPQAQILAKGSVLDALNRRGAGNIRHGVFAELLPGDIAARLTDVATLPTRTAPLGLGQGRDLFGDGFMLAIDLPGHAEGHFGVCFPKLAVPLLYAVDAQWLLAAILENRVPGFPASLIAENALQLAESVRRVADFHRAGGMVMLCHDPIRTPYDLPDQA